MYYAHIGELCAINKTRLQCARSWNNLSDTMEKGGEGMEEMEGGRQDSEWVLMY